MLYRILEQRLAFLLGGILSEIDLASIQVRPCADARFGDYQTSSLIPLAKARKFNPRQFATEIASKLEASDICDSVEVAGPGFLNFRLTPAAVARVLEAAGRGEHLFSAPLAKPRRVVIDFSSPNVAKPMHVGHIRSTILGDSLARVLRLLGCEVITDNHLGDWGTQFGKLLLAWKRDLDRAALAKDPIGEMERLYKKTQAESEANPVVQEQAREELVKLQNGDSENLRLWHEMIALSQLQFDAIYQRLGVRFDVVLGESFYNDRLKSVVDRLAAAGLAQQSQGAMVVYFEDVPALKGHPAIVQKSDGAANYTTTDLAALEYRLERWSPDEIIYVTDGRQQLHFQQLFTIFRRWRPEAAIKLSHVWFGSILGEDGKPFKTRSGGTVKLGDLLDEAEERALKIVTEKNPRLGEVERREIARVVGIGAIKYADLLQNRQSDYVFSWEKMLALTGNTAPYLQYAYTRIRSIFRKGGEEAEAQPIEQFQLTAPEEFALGKHLLDFGLILEAVVEEYRPNFLCNYLYELAGKFTGFYENCPVLKAAPETRATRLALCDLTAKVLKQGLEALGIETTEKM